MALTVYWVDLSKTGHNMAKAIFQNGCQIPYPPYLDKYVMQSNICGMCRYVLEDSEFKYTIFGLLRHLFLPFLKMAVFNINVIISQKLHCVDVWYIL